MKSAKRGIIRDKPTDGPICLPLIQEEMLRLVVEWERIDEWLKEPESNAGPAKPTTPT